MIKPKLLLDENIGSLVAGRLRAEGYDVSSVLEVFRGMRDRDILNLAIKEERILAALDKDFGNLIFHLSQKHVGVILIEL